MELDWCLNCGRKTDSDGPYCSKICKNLDTRQLPQSLPARPRSFPVPSLAPPSNSLPPLPRLPRSVASPFPKCLPATRFRDDELQDVSPSTITARWAGKDTNGILVWAQAVSPGLDDDDDAFPPPPPLDPSELSVLATFHVSHPPPPFPLTSQNLAPPCLSSFSPLHHALLSHTSNHPSSHDEPSLSPDDASLCTPATESVITPSAPDSRPSPKSLPLVARFVTKVSSWISSPSRPSASPPRPRITLPPLDPLSPPSETDITQSSAINLSRASLPHAKLRPRPRVDELGNCRPYIL